jgi:membrane-bound lytic murein transglycosylase D
LLLLLALTATAWAQTAHYSVPAALVEDEFSTYHEALSGAADSLLASAPRSPEASSLGSAAHAPRPNDSLLRQFVRQYWDGQEQNVRRAVERIAQLRPALDPILREEGVPADIVALALVESGGRTTALSPKGALGLWQLMPETARRYGLKVSPGQDERVDIVKSTRAAARCLRDLYAQFGNWNLAFAAYNAGEQAIQRAVEQNGVHDFESLSRSRQLPLETSNYVPAVFSAVRLLEGAVQVRARRGQPPSKVRVVYAGTVFSN